MNSKMDSSYKAEVRVSELLASSAGIDVLSELQAIDPLSLNYAGRLEYLEALQKQTGWLDALMQSALFAVAGEAPGKPDGIFGVDELEREDISTVLKLSPGTAQIKIDIARTLTNHLPNVCSALAMGEISGQVASIIARESEEAVRLGMSSDQIAEIESKALAHAECHSPVQVANKIRTTIAKLAPEKFEEQAVHAKESRSVNMYPEKFGMATIVALLPAPAAQNVMLAIDKMARIAQAKFRDEMSPSSPSSPRRLPTLEALRADALSDLAAEYLATNTDIAPQHRRPVTVNVTIDLATALGFEDNPGHLAGYGAIPASVARELAANGKWRRFITDPVTGALLDYGRQTYEPPQALVDFILARDQICRFPGCRQPGRVADIDHAIPWESGGATSRENMGLLCRRHHRIKTNEGWTLVSHSDGSCTWMSPEGKEHFVPARPVTEVA